MSISSKPNDASITLDKLSQNLDFDPAGCVRVLVRHQYLQSVSGPRKKVQGYRRGPSWPAPESFFKAGPVGFTYFVQKWFRFYLQAYILQQMAQLESREHILQLDYIQSNVVDSEGFNLGNIPHAEGNWVDRRGVRWAVDLQMLDWWSWRPHLRSSDPLLRSFALDSSRRGVRFQRNDRLLDPERILLRPRRIPPKECLEARSPCRHSSCSTAYLRT